MPKSQVISVVYENYEVTKDVPASYKEADDLVGETGAALDGFISDCVARNFLPRLYKHVSNKLADLGHPRVIIRQEKKKDDTVLPIYESHIAHIGRVHEKNPTFRSKIGELLQSTATEIAFFERGERQGGGGRISQGATDTANAFFAEGKDTVEQKVLFMELTVPGLKIGRDAEGKITPESLARGIQTFSNYYRKEGERKAKAQLNVAT